MASSQSMIAERAATVATHSNRLDSYLSKEDVPHPSFEADGLGDLKLPSDIEQSRSRSIVIEASQELNDLLQGPRNILFNHITYEDLAASVGVDCATLRRILRFGIAFRVFAEPHPGVVAHSAASRQIAEDPSIADWVGANVDDMWPAAEKVVDALAKWPLAQEPNQTGFAMANLTSKSFYTQLSQGLERTRRFGGAMGFFTTGLGYSLHHLTDNYPWNSLGHGTVVDLGESHGETAFALARNYPDLHLVVQELPDVIGNSKEQPGVNVKFMAHDFFEEQPIKNADVYLYRWIFHNWPDKYCGKALAPALKTGFRVFIMDSVIPPPGSIEQADQRFEFIGMQQPSGSSLAILEATRGG
ncbi:putative O-methyltransferase [Hypoxylon sp. FL1150]|nr:putative O-methyltransferase [Hypoxylon sp. FL1150]